MGTIPLPLPISLAVFAPDQNRETYSKIFADTMGNLATPADGMDETLASMGALLDGFGAEMDAEAAAGTLDTALGAVGSFDPSALDAHIANYEGAIPAGNQILADAGTPTPPSLLELPITLDFSQGIKPAPIQTSFDAGTVKVHSAAIEFLVGRREPHAGEGSTGIYTMQLFSGDPAIFDVDNVDKESHAGVDQGTDFNVQINPAKVGTFQAQYNALTFGLTSDILVTVNVVVVP